MANDCKEHNITRCLSRVSRGSKRMAKPGSGGGSTHHSVVIVNPEYPHFRPRRSPGQLHEICFIIEYGVLYCIYVT